MTLETIHKLCCPFDKADLELTPVLQDIHQAVIEGFLVCKSCRRLYPIVKGVPIMTPDNYREPLLEQPLLDRWSAHLQGRKMENFRMLPASDDGLTT